MRIELTGQSNGSGGFRFRVYKRDRKFFRGMKKVKLELPNPNGESFSIIVKLTKSFRDDCPELRHRKITEWMRDRGDRKWSDKQPPKYEAEPNGNHLRVIRRTK